MFRRSRKESLPFPLASITVTFRQDEQRYDVKLSWDLNSRGDIATKCEALTSVLQNVVCDYEFFTNNVRLLTPEKFPSFLDFATLTSNKWVMEFHDPKTLDQVGFDPVSGIPFMRALACFVTQSVELLQVWGECPPDLADRCQGFVERYGGPK